MLRSRVFLLFSILCLFCFTAVYAQETDNGESDGDPYITEPDDGDDGSGGDTITDGGWDLYTVDLYASGDQIIAISLGLSFPVLFTDSNGRSIMDRQQMGTVGGTGSLAYSRFLGPSLFVGGEIAGSFNNTIQATTIFIWSIGARAGWQFLFGRLEFPLSFAIGIAPQTHNGGSYLGMFMRGGGAAFFRFNPDWSFGVNGDWTWYPQRPKDISKTVYGNMLNVTVSARYHF